MKNESFEKMIELFEGDYYFKNENCFKLYKDESKYIAFFEGEKISFDRTNFILEDFNYYSFEHKFKNVTFKLFIEKSINTLIFYFTILSKRTNKTIFHQQKSIKTEGLKNE